MASNIPEGLQIDVDNLYREETYSDMGAVSIRVMTPVTVEGERDPERPVMYIGDTTLMTQVGPIPVQFPIEAASLSEALDGFPEGVAGAIERLNERAREVARDEASRIVVPGAGGGGLPGGGLPGGGLGGGGKIVLD